MNVSTKTWLLELLDAEEQRIRKIREIQLEDCDPTNRTGILARMGNELARINDVRLLVEQGPEEPRR
jgi:hypothetical protein